MYPQNSYDNKQSNYFYQVPGTDFCVNREKVSCMLLAAKQYLNLTYEEIAEQIGGSKEWIAAVILGQESMNKEDATKLTRLLCVEPYVAEILQQAPMRGAFEREIPTDPLIYRFYEVMQVYGTSMKAIINEMFGDGIFSAINLKINIDKRPDDEDPEGERVVITLDGKFLPYEKW